MLSHHRAGSGEPLVLIHGIGSQWRVWRPLLDLLTPHRDVIAIDLPGFGDSPELPSGVKPTPYALTDAVGSFLDELGLERPLVAGNSLGGLLALELARRGRVRAAVPISPAGFQLPRERAWMAESLLFQRNAARAINRLAPGLIRNPFTRTPLLAGLQTRPWRMPPEDAAGALANLGASPGFDATMEELARFTFAGGEDVCVPVTLVWGTLDAVLLPRQAGRALRVVPTARLVWLHGAGHVPTYDAADEIARILLAA